MRKVICLFFIVLLMLSACSQSEANHETSSTQNTSEAAIQTETTAPPETAPTEPETDIGIAPGHLYPFVYTESESWSWFRSQLIPHDYVPGYLYVENSRTNSVSQILDEQVIIFTETTNYLYCITQDGRIVQTDYEGGLYKVLYTYTRGSHPCIEYQDGRIVFMDGSHVIIMDAETGDWQDVGEAPGMAQLHPASENYLLMKDPDGKFYGFDIRNGEIIALTTNAMIDDLLDGCWPGEKPEEEPELPAVEPELQYDGTPSWYPQDYTSQPYGTFFSGDRQPYSYCLELSWRGRSGEAFYELSGEGDDLTVIDAAGGIRWTVPVSDDRDACIWMVCDGCWAYGVRSETELVRMEILTGKIELLFSAPQFYFHYWNDQWFGEMTLIDHEMLYFLARTGDRIGVYRLYLPEMKLELLHDRIPGDTLLHELKLSVSSWNHYWVDCYYMNPDLQSILLNIMKDPTSDYRRVIVAHPDSNPPYDLDLSPAWEIGDIENYLGYSNELNWLITTLQGDYEMPALINVVYDNRNGEITAYYAFRTGNGIAGGDPVPEA